MRSLSMTRAPRFSASLLAARVTAASRLNGPSALIAVAGRMAPTTTTGFLLLTVRSRKKAVSSRVSVPWVMTTPLVSRSESLALIDLAILRRMAWLMSPLATLEICSPLTLATFLISGTALSSTSIPSAPAV